MSTAQLRLKHPAGWFAAGREIEFALGLLSDTTFKLFVWLCLHADRGHGALKASPADIARSLNKDETEIRAGLNELVGKGVCRPIQDDIVEVADRFWPYERRSHVRPADDLLLRYHHHIKKLFLERRCVRSAFTAADESLAAELYRNGVPLQTVERAIFLGSIRKYVSLVNNGAGTPITTLRYFIGLVGEVEQTQASADYWRYIEYKVHTIENLWPIHGSLVVEKDTK
jgi:hypothetical protein